MNTTALTRLQIRLVMTVFRSEMARLAELHPMDGGTGAGAALRTRSIELLMHARTRLSDETAHLELHGELDVAGEELARGTGRVSALI